MNKSKQFNNKLINRKTLKKILAENKIRAGRNVIEEIEKLAFSNLKKLILEAKEKMLINGRKNMKGEDLHETEEIFSEMD
jgi:histone H3/H4